MSAPTEEEDTLPPAARYLRAEGWFDRHVAEPLTGSPVTLLVLAVSHFAAFVLGAWAF